jgi:hypothetical protein
MTTFNQDGTTAKAHSLPDVEPDPDIQLSPPDDDEALTVDEVEADYQAATSRVKAGLPPQPGDDDKLAAIADIASDHADDPSELAGKTAHSDESRVFDAEIITADQDEQPGTEVAIAQTFDVTLTDEVWDHDFLVFKGDKLGIRVPTRQALAAFSLASGKYVDIGVKNDLTGLFIARHLSPESYGRVFSRLMDPDESDYDVDTVGELFNAIVTASLQEPATGDDKP